MFDLSDPTEILTRPPGCPGRRAGRGGRAFTLTELLVVISIIVMMLAMAVPLFNVLSGSRSIEAGQNKVSAVLQRARARAIGLQERRGVFFFKDVVTGQTGMIVVKMIDPAPASTVYQMELDGDMSELEFLPPGVGATFFSPQSSILLNYRLNGLILFDGLGRIQQLPFTPTGPQLKDQYEARIGTTVLTQMGTDNSGFAMMLFDATGFANQTPDVSKPEIIVSASQKTWLDSNAAVIQVSRYNGTVVRGE